MKARVVEIASGREYTDKQRRVTLKFEGASSCFDKVILPESSLGWAAGAVALDDEIEVTLTKVNIGQGLELTPVAPLPTVGDEVVASPGFVPNPVGLRIQEAKADEEIPF